MNRLPKKVEYGIIIALIIFSCVMIGKQKYQEVPGSFPPGTITKF